MNRREASRCLQFLPWPMSFRAHYGGAQKTSLAALRKPYDELVMKVLDMLDERDPSLARSISSSREAIWEILADRERFGLMQ